MDYGKRIEKLEEIVKRLVQNKAVGYIYVLIENELYDGIETIKGCFSTPESVYKKVEYILGYSYIPLQQIEDMDTGSSIESDSVGNQSVTIRKFAIE